MTFVRWPGRNCSGRVELVERAPEIAPNTAPPPRLRLDGMTNAHCGLKRNTERRAGWLEQISNAGRLISPRVTNHLVTHLNGHIERPSHRGLCAFGFANGLSPDFPPPPQAPRSRPSSTTAPCSAMENQHATGNRDNTRRSTPTWT